MAEHETLHLGNAKIITKPGQAHLGPSPARNERFTTTLLRNILGRALEVHTNIPSCLERKVSEMKQFSESNIRNWGGRAELVFPQRIILHDSNHGVLSFFTNPSLERMF